MTKRESKAARKKARTERSKGSPFDKGHFCDLCGIFYDNSDLRHATVVVGGQDVQRLACRTCRKTYRWMEEA